MFKIVYAEGVADDLARLTEYRRKAILNAIEKQLQHEPNVETRHRKKLPGLIPPWEHVLPFGNCGLVRIAFSMTLTRQRRR